MIRELYRKLQFPDLGDERGKLVVAEGEMDIPFAIQRVFYIYGSDPDVVRGQHANRDSEFVLINVAGSSKVMITDGENKEIVELKIELADIILRGDADEIDAAPAENERMIRFVGVTFKPGGKVYDYIWNGPEEAKVGDTVQVEGRWNGWTEVEVVSVFRKTADQCGDEDYKCAYPAE